MVRLGVNIDHIATIREARKTYEPDPVFAAYLAELAGADGITIHLREDRRHIKERDLEILKKTVTTHLNLEMAASEKIVKIALKVKPDQATLVPEKREEVTTEGGLDAAHNFKLVEKTVKMLKDAGIFVSLFVDAEKKQLKASKDCGADAVEIHTGRYANAKGEKEKLKELSVIKSSAKYAKKLGLKVFAGHGLNYKNAADILKIREIEELNIGHSIISRAAYVGLKQAVEEMLRIIRENAYD